jgi:carboxymethylenebutenolidase
MSDKDYVQITVSDGTTMQSYTAVPSNKEKKYPGIIIFQEAFGVNNHIINVTERLAKQGFVAIAPELFHRSAGPGFVAEYGDFSQVGKHIQALTEQGLGADAQAAWDWLNKHQLIQQDNIACIGFCMGGLASFIANTVLPFKAAISYYGGRIVPDFVKKAESLHGPMLFFWAGQDKHIPHENVEKIVEELNKAKKDFINIEISYADHGFNCDERSSYNEHAAKEAWAITTAFLNNKLEIK